MSRTRSISAASLLLAGLTLGGCAATGLTPEAYEITKAECAATVTHLANTEPEFASIKDQNSPGPSSRASSRGSATSWAAAARTGSFTTSRAR